MIGDMAMLTASTQLRSSGWDGSANRDQFIRFGGSSNWSQPLIEQALSIAARYEQYYHLFLSDLKSGLLRRALTQHPLANKAGDENNFSGF